MDIVTTEYTVEKVYSGHSLLEVPTGKYLTILNDQEEIFKQKPTAGKKWEATITLRIEESKS